MTRYPINPLQPYQQALDAAYAAHDDEAIEEALRGLLRVADELGDWDTIGEVSQKALALFEKQSRRDAQARVYRLMGLAYLNKGAHDEALHALNQSLQIAAEEQLPTDEQNAYEGLGDLYVQIGRPRQAISNYESALELAETQDDKAIIGSLLSRIGMAHVSRKKLPEATQCFERALALAREVDNQRAEANLLGQLGVCYQLAADWPAARDAYQQAVDAVRKTGDLLSLAGLLGNLGTAYTQEGRYNDALHVTTEAHHLFTQLDMHDLADQAEAQINRLHDALGD